MTTVVPVTQHIVATWPQYGEALDELKEVSAQQRTLAAAHHPPAGTICMNVRTFVDTNILIYAHDRDARPEARTAKNQTHRGRPGGPQSRA